MKPTTVTVNWSESPDFRDGEVVEFAAFERRARTAAYKRGSGGGYDKTNVTVAFDNGDTVGIRLDLAENDTHGVEHHVRGYLRFLETERGRDYYERVGPAGRAFLDALRQIRFT